MRPSTCPRPRPLSRAPSSCPLAPCMGQAHNVAPCGASPQSSHRSRLLRVRVRRRTLSLPRVRGSGFGTPLCGGRRKPPHRQSPNRGRYRYRISDAHGRGRSTSPMGIPAPALPHSQTWARKGSMEQSVHRPLFKSGLCGYPPRQFRNP